jgi:hypothetical protein
MTGDPSPQNYTFDRNGGLTFPDGAIIQNSGFLAGPGQNAVLGQNDAYTQVYTMQNGVGIQTYDSSTYYSWLFDNAGVMTMPSGGDITFDTSATSYIYGITGVEFADSTTQTTAYAPVTGEWTLTTGSNTVSFTVSANASYTMWVRGNIPNGIVVWNATVSLSNTNVPVIGNQYGWYYAAGNNLVLDTMPDQIIGTTGVISSATVVTTTANVFSFGITNNSGSAQTVQWGYTKI